MCLYCDGIRRTADRDIRVWKKILIVPGGNSWRGLFMYNDKTFPFDEVCEESGEYDGNEMVAGGFFHSCADRHDAVTTSWRLGVGERCIVECTIPDGASYYTDKEWKEFASDKIIVHKPKKR